MIEQDESYEVFVREEMTSPVDLYRQRARDCRLRSEHARNPADKAEWLNIAEGWQKLAEEADATNAPVDRPKGENN